MKILLDPAHGLNVAGKRSVDGRLREYEYSREICNEVAKQLRAEGYDVDFTTLSNSEPGLSKRVAAVNAWCDKLGAKNVCVVSIHNNAAGSGAQWLKATGWEAWTSVGQTQGDKLADCLYDAAEEILRPIFPGVTTLIRTDLRDGDRDKEKNFDIVAKTKCAACLTENFFMDNKTDVDWLLSPEGKYAITRLHVLGIKNYVKKYA